MLSHTRMGVPYEYTHMGRPIRVWANIRIWGRTFISCLFTFYCTIEAHLSTLRLETSHLCNLIMRVPRPLFELRRFVFVLQYKS